MQNVFVDLKSNTVAYDIITKIKKYEYNASVLLMRIIVVFNMRVVSVKALTTITQYDQCTGIGMFFLIFSEYHCRRNLRRIMATFVDYCWVQI